jgi:hypothetical protein
MPPSAPPDSPCRPARSSIGAQVALELLPFTILAGATATRLWVRGALSLADLPGPGGVKVLAALGVGHTGRDWTTWLVASALPLFSDAPLPAAVFVMVASSVAAVLGAILAGQAIGGRPAGLAAGCIAALWSQAIHPAVVIGADGVAMGASWLGLGLVWWGSRSLARLPAVLVGAGLLSFSLLVKVTAAPVVVLAALVPLTSGSVPLAIAATLLAGVMLSGASLGGPGATDVAVHWPRGAAADLLAAHPERFVFGVLGQLALVGALVPGRRWLARLALFAVLTVTLDVAAESGGLKARPRHLATGALGLVVLSGWALGVVPTVLSRLLLLRLPRPVRPATTALAAVPVLLFMGFLAQDSLGFFHGWASVRSHYLRESSCQLPRPDPSWSRLYNGLSTHVFTDHSDPGADVLVEFGETAPPGGVATVVLRDNREFHLLAGAAIGHHRATILDPGKCCRGTVDAACAKQVVRALDRAGALVVLPTDVGLQRTPRVNHPHDRFLSLLLHELDGVEERTRWWRVWQGTGSGGSLPCSQGVGR